jgi:hypothetical protein
MMRTIFSHAMMSLLIISMAAACKSPETSSPSAENPTAPATEQPTASDKPAQEQPAADDAQACVSLVTAFTKETDTTYYMIVDPCWPKSMSTADVRETYYKPFQQRVEAASGKPWQKVIPISANYKGRQALDAQVQGMKGTNVEIKLEDEKKGE